MKDYERFNEELYSLSHWAEEAEKVLKEPDPAESPDILTVQEHMEKLKVKNCLVELRRLYAMSVLTIYIRLSTEPNVEA